MTFKVIMFFALAFLGLQKAPLDVGSLNYHLSQYAKYNQSHHDNIDDSYNEHTHTHRHGENDKEHEHHHDHSRVVPCEIQYLTKFEIIDNMNSVIEGKQTFFVKNLISTAHPSRLFRPPIS